MRALQDTHARAARLFVIFGPPLVSDVEPVLCFCCFEAALEAGGLVLAVVTGEFEPASTELIGAGDTDRWLELLSDILLAVLVPSRKSQCL